MRKFVLPVLASLALATPALANESRIEARGGIVWSNGNSEAVAGVAAGYDFDLGSNAFAGVEVAADKTLTAGTRVYFSPSLRLGMKTGSDGKAYVTGGWQSKQCGLCSDAWNLGAGFQQGFGQNLYGKVEYRHQFADKALSADSNTVMVGIGTRF